MSESLIRNLNIQNPGVQLEGAPRLAGQADEAEQHHLAVENETNLLPHRCRQVQLALATRFQAFIPTFSTLAILIVSTYNYNPIRSAEIRSTGSPTWCIECTFLVQ